MKHALALPPWSPPCSVAPSSPRNCAPATYQKPSNALLLQGAAAVAQLARQPDVAATGPGPVLVAPVVNGDRATRRWGHVQYANAMAATGFDVRRSLRGEVFVKEGAGELLLSREIKTSRATRTPPWCWWAPTRPQPVSPTSA